MATDHSDITDTYDRISVAKVPEKVPDPKTHFIIVKNEKLGALGDNDVLIELEYISVDPYLRFRLRNFLNPIPVQSGCVAKVIKCGEKVKTLFNTSKGKEDYVFGIFPWQTKSIVPAKSCIKIKEYKKTQDKTIDTTTNDTTESKQSEDSNIELSHYIGAYGMPGQTAYYGLYQIGELKSTDNVLCSGAAGAVGSMVGQLASIKGCKKIVGTAGTNDKCNMMTKNFGYTNAINYKDNVGTKPMQKALADVFGKDGIDVYFDNTGGDVTNAVWDLLNEHGRVVICGQISQYNKGKDIEKIDQFLMKTIYKEIRIQGIFVGNFRDKKTFYKDVGEWINQGKIYVAEELIGGFDNAPDAFCKLFSGANTGKMIVDIKYQRINQTQSDNSEQKAD